jgi:hypothetical protein
MLADVEENPLCTDLCPCVNIDWKKWGGKHDMHNLKVKYKFDGKITNFQ